jgi:hypothetical protein
MPRTGNDNLTPLPKPAADMTRDELRAWCKANKVSGYTTMTAPELRTRVASLVAVQAADAADVVRIRAEQAIAAPERRTLVANTIALRAIDSLAEAAHIDIPDRGGEETPAAPVAPTPVPAIDVWRPSAQAFVDSRTPRRYAR